MSKIGIDNHLRQLKTERVLPLILFFGQIVSALAGKGPVYVQDSPSILKPPEKTVLESLLREHDRLSDQSLSLKIVDQVKNRGSLERSNLGRPENVDNSGLIVVILEEETAQMDLGIRLAPLLEQTEINSLLKRHLIPAIRDQKTGSGAIQVVLKILDQLESPLIENGKAQELVSRHNVRLESRQPVLGNLFFGFSAGLGFLFLLMVIYFFLQSEVHFYREGVLQVNPIYLAIWEFKHRLRHENQ